LWESKPYHHTLRLRLLVDEDQIEEAKALIEQKLASLTHCYGAYGKCGAEKYDGEARDWGLKSWEKGLRFLELGSEFALELTENRAQFGRGNHYKRDPAFYADKCIHYFLNQIEPLLIEVNGFGEADFELQEGTYRHGLSILKDASAKLTDEAIHDTLWQIQEQVVKENKQNIQSKISAILGRCQPKGGNT
jgi:hypothetical protein